MSTLERGGDTRQPLLEADGLMKRFGTHLVVPGFALRARAGELIALAGANGSGKSTVLRLLAGLLRPDGGSGRVLGCELPGLDRRTRNAIGFLPQRAALYAGLSVYENLRFRAAVAGLQAPGSVADRCLAELELGSRRHQLLTQFSGGWTRRIELAATLLHRPRLLLLDEPTSGLDARASAGMWEQLAACLAAGTVIIFSSHASAELERADRCLTMPEASDAR